MTGREFWLLISDRHPRNKATAGAEGGLQASARGVPSHPWNPCSDAPLRNKGEVGCGHSRQKMPLLVALRCSASAPQGAGERTRLLGRLPAWRAPPARGPAVLEVPAAGVSGRVA